MARVLCVWEQGSNLGHLSQLKRPMEVALDQGHTVFLAARELHRAKDVLGDMPITYLQAPFKQNVVPMDHSRFLSYTHILQRQCFSSVQELEMLVRAWRGLFDLVKPDLVMYDHSPTAQIASRDYAFKRVRVGTGFTVPPLRPEMLDPFLPFITTRRDTTVDAALRADDAHLLAIVNAALAAVGASALTCLADIYTQVDAQFLFSWPQLDHFGFRPGQEYLGAASVRSPNVPHWPPGAGPRVYGYLQNMPALERLLQDLQAAGVCALLYVRDLPPALRQAYISERMRFTEALVDLGLVAAQADWVINHGNLNTTTTFMLHGVPQLLIPRHQEQLFVVLQMLQHGCAVMAYQDQPGFSREIASMLGNGDLAVKARALQAQCQKTGVVDCEAYIQACLRNLLKVPITTDQ